MGWAQLALLGNGPVPVDCDLKLGGFRNSSFTPVSMDKTCRVYATKNKRLSEGKGRYKLGW